MNTNERADLRRLLPLPALLPLTSQLSSYSWHQARGGLVAGLAAAAVLVPNSMAYGHVAGLSPAAGLYTALAATVAYALFASTRAVAVGPTAVMAIMTFTAVHDRAHGDPRRAVALAAGLALVTGAVCLAGSVGRLGAFSDLLSEPVMLGYLVGSGVVVIAGQAKKLVGVTVPESGAIVQIWRVVTHLNQAHPLTAALGGGSLAILVLLPVRTSRPVRSATRTAATPTCSSTGWTPHCFNADRVRELVLGLAIDRDPSCGG